MNPNNDNNQEPNTPNNPYQPQATPSSQSPPIAQPHSTEPSEVSLLPQPASTSTINSSPTPLRTTSRDRVIGIIFGVIGLLGVAGATLSLIDFYQHAPGSGNTPPTIYFVVPLLFLYSGYYYINGLNAARIQRKQGDGSIIKKNYQKFRLVELVLIILIISSVVYPIWYTNQKQSTESQATASPSDKATLDKKRTEVANNLAAAEKKYQKENPGQAKMGLDYLGVDYTDPASGENYGFSGGITEPSPDGKPYALSAIHLGEGLKCNPDGSGYMIDAGTKNSFAFAIERETQPPICYDFKGTLNL